MVSRNRIPEKEEEEKEERRGEDCSRDLAK